MQGQPPGLWKDSLFQITRVSRCCASGCEPLEDAGAKQKREREREKHTLLLLNIVDPAFGIHNVSRIKAFAHVWSGTDVQVRTSV